MSELLRAALGYAAQGWPIFPCKSDKTPYTKHGVVDATTDAEVIRAWWEKYPRANIGLDCAGAGFMVLDLDPGHDWDELERNVGEVPQTKLVQRTPRGGEHLFYALREGEIVSPSASKLAANVDVRSFHSYVLLAPSQTTDGHYVWESEGKPAFRSTEMVRVANAHREKHEDRDTWIIEADLPQNVEAAIKWLKKDAEIAIEGRGGDNCAYATAAMMKSYGISQQLAFDLIWEYWNPRCDPPWSADEVEHLEQKIVNGYQYNTSPPGNVTEAYHVARRQQLFKPVKKELGKGKNRGLSIEVKPWRFFDRQAMRHMPPPSWLIPDLLPNSGYCQLYGSQSSLKTFIALDLALRVATGTAPMWLPDSAAVQGPVLFAVGEGATALNNRVRAWEHRNPLTRGVRDNFKFVNPVPKVTHEIEPFIDGALEMNPDGYKLLVIDTIGRAMQGANENSQEDASTFTAMIEALQLELGCTVLAIGHTGHDSKDRIRGSTVFAADVDTGLLVQRREKELKAAVSMQKQKDAPEWETAKLIEFEEVALSDDVRTLVACGTPKVSRDTGEGEMRIATRTQLQLDLVVRNVLTVHKHRDFSDRELAELIAMREDVDIGSEALRKNHFKRLREKSGSYASQAYDPLKKRWRYFVG